MFKDAIVLTEEKKTVNAKLEQGKVNLQREDNLQQNYTKPESLKSSSFNKERLHVNSLVKNNENSFNDNFQDQRKMGTDQTSNRNSSVGATVSSTTSEAYEVSELSNNQLKLSTIDEAIQYYASQPCTCLSLRNLIDLGQGETHHMPKVYHTSLIKSMNLLSHHDNGQNSFITPYASFLFDELPIRFARGITHLESIPWITEEIEEFATLKTWYTKSFQEVYYLQNVKEIQLAEEIFSNTLRRIQDRHRNELHVIAKGTYKLRDILKNVTNLHQTDAYLDNYFYHYQLQEEGEKEKLQNLHSYRQNQSNMNDKNSNGIGTSSKDQTSNNKDCGSSLNTNKGHKKDTSKTISRKVTQKSKNTVSVNKTYIYFNHEEDIDFENDEYNKNAFQDDNMKSLSNATNTSWSKWREWSKRQIWNNRVHSMEDEKENLNGIHLLDNSGINMEEDNHKREETIYFANKINECDDIHYFLDRFHLKRLSLRVLIGHFLELRHQKAEKEANNHLKINSNREVERKVPVDSEVEIAFQKAVGIVVPQMDVVDIIQRAITDVESLCQEMYGQHPEIHLRLYSKENKQCIYENKHHNIHQSMSKLGHSAFFTLYEYLFNNESENDLWKKRNAKRIGKDITSCDNSSNPISCCYVPDHLYYVICELLKNAMRATMDRHHREYRSIVNRANRSNNMDMLGSFCFTGYDSDENIIGHLMAPITIDVQEVTSLISGNQVSIKVSDEGGGIPTEELDHIWCYLYSTASTSTQDIEFIHSYKDEDEKKKRSKGGYDYEYEKPDHQGGGVWSVLDEEETEAMKRGEIIVNRAMRKNQPKAQLAGLGYGLPIARLYSNYFGGKLQLVSRPGQGLDAYITLNKNGEAMEPLL